MASSQIILKISDQSQTQLINYLKQLNTRYRYQYNIRSMLELIDREYYREANNGSEHAMAKIANNAGDMSRFQDLTVPIVMDQVETWVAFMTDVFCSGTPLFPVVAAPKYMDAATQMNAVIDNQARVGRWKAELVKFFRDCAKYNLGACELSWGKVNTAIIETDTEFSTIEGKPRNIIWEGNNLKRLDLYNTFWDTSVAPQSISETGEYAGYNELVSRTRLKQIVAALGDEAIIKNIAQAYKSGTPSTEYYVPAINPDALINDNLNTAGDTNWFNWAGIKDVSANMQYKGSYILTTLYARILPSDFNIQAPQPNTPQIWKLLIINFDTIIYIERQTNAHDRIPIFFASPNDDGIKYQSKSLAVNVKPYQQLASALANSMIDSRRRAISDKGLYNPLYVESKHINSKNPAAKIPVKPTAYAGVSLNEVYMPIPFRDDQASIIMQEIQIVNAMADDVGGLNKAQRGKFVKGNKTAGEFNNIMDNADSRLRTQAIVLGDQFFTPIKHVIGINILQFQGTENLFYEADAIDITIDPLLLRNSIWEFKITDGTAPKAVEINDDAWQVAMQVLSSNPQLGANFNIAPLFSYLMKLKGADIKDFQKSPEQLQYEQALAAWQQTVMQLAEQGITEFPPQPQMQQAQPQAPERPPSIVDQIIAAEQPQ